MDVPEDLLLQILLRLPPKSLVRFKCVSKAWETMIDGRQFMLQYLRLTYTDSSSTDHSLHLIFRAAADFHTSSMFLLPSESDDEKSEDESEDEDYNDEQLIDLKGAPGITEVFGDVFDPEVYTHYYPQYHHSVCGPINGIYCVNIIRSKPHHIEPQVRFVRVAFWSSGMRQFHVLPPIPRPAMLDVLRQHFPVLRHEDVRTLNLFHYGFVFDPVSQDYKYFCISEYGDKFGCSRKFVCFHLYSLASNSWQELHHSHITFPPDVIDVYDHGESFFRPNIGMGENSTALPFNRSCHWIYYGADNVGLIPKVLSFDIVEHAFCVSVIPPTLVGEARLNYVKLMTVDGFLAVASPAHAYVSSVIGIIVMKEYGVDESWFRAYNIVLNSPARFIGSSEGKLFVQDTDGWVVSYRLGVGAHHKEYHEYYCHVPFDNFEMLPFEGSLTPIRTVH